ncbi:hypothetical protein, partial [Limnothrix sp. PR1529]|uniref:hypothetical protein n=1 Tax=Limnothrix sp. PR1529 TaxID=1704291 RepID=UPI001F32429D
CIRDRDGGEQRGGGRLGAALLLITITFRKKYLQSVDFENPSCIPNLVGVASRSPLNEFGHGFGTGTEVGP